MTSRVIMIVSLALLIAAMFGLVYNNFIDNQAVDISPSEKPAVSYTVWETRNDVALGEPITQSMLQRSVLTEEEGLEKGVNGNINIDFQQGMVVRRSIEKGDVLRPEDLSYPEDDDYFRLVIDPGNIPFSLTMPPQSSVAGVIKAGDLIDILALTSMTQNLSSGETIRDFEGVNVAPVLMGIKVLQVRIPKQDESWVGDNVREVPSPTYILELTRKQAAKLTIARRIAQLEMYLSAGEVLPSELSADAGDIMTEYKAVKEYRGQLSRIR